jgi:hypothetical protein
MGYRWQGGRSSCLSGSSPAAAAASFASVQVMKKLLILALLAGLGFFAAKKLRAN